MANFQKSSLNLRSINYSFTDTSRSLSSVNNSVGRISKIVSNNTRNKNILYQKSDVIDFRRREASRRQEIEDQSEAKNVSIIPQKGLLYSRKLSGSPLNRLLGFLGFVTAGWIVNNLPTWIFMGKEFVSRIYKFGGSLYSMVDEIQTFTRFFGDTLKNSFDAIVRLDFSEFTEGKVLESFNSMTETLGELGQSMNAAFEVFRTPLNRSLDTGEEAPPLGGTRTGVLFPDIAQETTSSGILNPQAAYAYLRQLGVSHIHALGILANIQGESNFKIAADETGRGTGGIGLFQYTEPTRKRRFLEASPDYRKNWKAQLKFAVTQDENTPAYLKKQFGSPEQAADDFMRNWENPDPNVYSDRRKVHDSFIRNFKTPTSVRTESTSLPNLRPQPVPTGPIKPLIGDRLGAGRNHGGVDLGVPLGTPLRAISDGAIVDSDYQPGGWGNFLVMRDNLGIYHLYGHMQEGYKRSGAVKKGQVIGRVGRTGRTTGPHLHWEAGTSWNGRKLENLFDALNYYSRYAPFNTLPDSGRASSPPTKPNLKPRQTPATINQPPSQIPQIAPEREGSNIVLMDMTQPQEPIINTQSSYSSMQPVIVDEFKILNNYIKNKLLLDLAYL